MDIPSKYSPAEQRLAREITANANAFRNGVHVRKNHPSYGITKQSLRDDLNRLIGMIEAFMYVTMAWDHPGRILWDREMSTKVKSLWGFEIDDLHGLLATV